MSRKERLWKIFVSMLYISAFTFGGGFVIVTFMKKKFVDDLHWLEENEMLDMTALAQSSPGPIAVNAAIQVGWKLEGFWGMIVGVIATIIPPMIILSVISFFYAAFATNHYVALVLKGMQCGVAAVLFDVVLGLGSGIVKKGRIIYVIMMAAAFVATAFLKINVIFIILAAAAVGIVLELLGQGEPEKNTRKEAQK